MSPAMKNDAILGFLAFLVLVQAIMVYAIFRLPAVTAEDATSAAARQASAMPAARGGAAASSGAAPAPLSPMSAAGQPRKARTAGGRYAPRHARQSGQDTGPQPKASGNPPWAQVPDPPRQHP